jgi:hypothetical protein
LDHDGCTESCAGEELGLALIANRGWLADDDLISRVGGMCLGEMMCKRLNDTARGAVAPYRLALPDASMQLGIAATAFYYVSQYRLRSFEAFTAKIAQYPAGSKFMLEPTVPRTDDQRLLEEKVEELVKRDGMSLERPSWWPAN